MGHPLSTVSQIDQRRGVGRDAREVERGHQKNWSKKRVGGELVVQAKKSWRKTSKESFFFSAKVEQERAYYRRSALRESLWSIWRVHIHKL